MANLSYLSTGDGYRLGTNNLDTDGYFAAIPAFQSVYFCDGRPVDNHGYHKLNFIGTRIEFDTPPTGAYTANEIVTQDQGVGGIAKGVYIECIDVSVTGTMSGDFTLGEQVTQATTGAVGYVAYSADPIVYIYPVYGTFTTGAYTITGAVSGVTLANPTAVSTIGYYHFVFRTTTLEFDTTNAVIGADSGSSGVPYDVDNPPHWLPWAPTAGVFPDGGSDAAALYLGRIFLNDIFHPNQWMCSRQGDPLDFDTSVDETDLGGASSSQVSDAGLVGDQIIGFIAYKNYYLIFGCATQMWILRGDPRQGGSISNFSYNDGLFSPESYCWDEFNNLYYMGLTGFYKLPPDIASSDIPPEDVLAKNYPNLVRSLNLNRRTDRVSMGYDKDRKVVNVTVCMKDGTWSTSFVYDVRSSGIFPEEYPGVAIPACYYFHDSYRADQRALLMGGQDGFIRKFDEATKHDVTTDSTEAIESFVMIGPVELSEVTRGEGVINEIQIDLSEESDNCSWELHVGKTAQAVADAIEDGATAFASGTFDVSTSVQNSIRTKIRDQWFAIKLYNVTEDKAWSFEGIEIDVRIAGKAKGA
ncbi:MAG: hypothetical protein WC451_03140 [Patescibacteria group bacterium]|jgi:hypothetical protein